MEESCINFITSAASVTVHLSQDGATTTETIETTNGAACYVIPDAILRTAGEFTICADGKTPMQFVVSETIAAGKTITLALRNGVFYACGETEKGDYTVTSVNGIKADSSGNVAISTGQPYNLLDNSDFRNPINQRGLSSQSASGQYFIDRWLVENSGGLGTASIDDDGLTLQSGASGYIGIVQRAIVESVKHLNGKTVTMAYCDADGNVYAQAVTAGAGSTKIGALNIYSTTFADTYAAFYFRLTSPNTVVKIRWVALYEGEYTADTLPKHTSKGYAAELLECQRYFQLIDGHYLASSITTAKRYYPVIYRAKMRTAPTVTITSATEYKTLSATGATVALDNSYSNMCRFSCTSSIADVTGGLWIAIKAQLSADL